jgi:hypothetical protein
MKFEYVRDVFLGIDSTLVYIFMGVIIMAMVMP